MIKSCNILIIGAGYVGCSMASIFLSKHRVSILDNNLQKVENIKKGRSPLNEEELLDIFHANQKNLNAFSSFDEISNQINEIDIAFIALPTDYKHDENEFDTSIIDEYLALLTSNPNLPIVIKSTVPIGYTKKQNEINKTDTILFSPEFLREGSAYSDNKNPSRVIISANKRFDQFVKELILDSANNQPPVFIMSSSEAESVKLFSNAYLAMRVSFFNELDYFSSENNLNPENIINGVSSDKRILDIYNNPSFGYGGYCLPKDTNQLISGLDEETYKLIPNIVKSNDQRIKNLTKDIKKYNHKKIGVYRVISKSDSDNFRESSTFKLIQNLGYKKEDIILYEPLINESSYFGYKVEKKLSNFKKSTDIIIANRKNEKDLGDVAEKIYTRDIFGLL